MTDHDELTGVELALFATEEERRAMKYVMLFEILLALFGYRNAIEQMVYSPKNKALMFSQFAEKLGETGDVYRLIDERCFAVELEGRLSSDAESELMAHIIYSGFVGRTGGEERRINQCKNIVADLNVQVSVEDMIAIAGECYTLVRPTSRPA